MMDSLSDRLKALGFIPASSVKKPEPQLDQFDFASVLSAQKLTNQFGDSYVVEKQYPLDYQHGLINFQTTTQIASLSTAAKVHAGEDANLNKLLFLDTETTGLSGGTGTIAFLVGLGYFTPNGFLLRQYILRDPSQEPAMLLEILNLCDQFTGIVTYNGKGFDIPLLKTRLILNRLPVPFENMAHFDLLHLSRKIWKNRLASRALQDLEHEILEIPRTDDEVPGWMIPEIYFNYLRSNDPNPLKGVVYHNGMDILSLAALFVYLSTSFENIQDSSQFNPIDYYSLGQIYFDLGLKEIAQNIFFQCIQQDSLPVQFKLIVFQRIAEIDKSQNNYEEALVYWQKAADFEDIDSSIEIAKYYEHTVKDYQSAYAWTENAISFLAKKGYHSYQNKKLGKELLKRKDRLQQRIERKNNHV